MQIPKVTTPSFKGTPIEFLKEVKTELFKVTWPSRNEVIKLTVIVIGVSIAIGLYVGGLDLIFTKMTDLLVNR